jgi:hypothetical protein
MIAAAEAFTIGTRAGVDPKILHDVIRTSSGNCWAIEHNCPVPGLVPKSASNRDFAAGFMTDLMAKDLSLARAAARDLGVPCFTGALAHDLYMLASRHGLGRKDFSSVIQLSPLPGGRDGQGVGSLAAAGASAACLHRKNADREEGSGKRRTSFSSCSRRRFRILAG